MLVGFLLTRLLSQRSSTAELLPSFRGEFEVAHHLPGRTRFRVSMLEGQGEQIAGVLTEKLREIPGIQGVEINLVSGSLKVEYDRETLEAPLLCGVLLKILGLSHLPDTRPKSLVQKEIKQVGLAVDRQVHDATEGVMDLNSSMGVVFLLLGLYKVLALKERTLPNGPNLLWWAFMIFRSGNR